ncbi:UPF0158 family protein [Zestomonas carbonaria]|uniref:Uncharacterized protein n=1 Tax=Zestomonas carbonaria TaxID=2762745 RepID=A0A7U7EJJ3_9GAMM|nr:UPF0158 family protein [Pseudomonas carbonaria]CAD5105778.1 hypothetical protein PSEWESI4_00035 [Pseudomonas carbonaria]
MRPLTIDLDELTLAMNNRSVDFYLDLHTGRVLPFYDDPELEKGLETEPDRYLAIETLDSRDDYRVMEAFISTVDHPHAYTTLEHALAGRKPFRAFKYALAEYPELEQAWLDFEATRLRELAVDWLEENDLRPARSFAAP